jgi:2'-5' RNA ligase
VSAEPRSSALLVPVPEAEPLVAELRLAHDPTAAAGIPAHVTLLYPFAEPSSIGDEVLEVLRTIFAASTPFHFRLVEARWFGEEVLYLAPDPAVPFVWMTERLASRFPVHTPYGGAFDEIVPHLTVAMRGSQEMVTELRPGLPVDAVAAEVLLMIEGLDDRWSVRERFPLGRRG